MVKIVATQCDLITKRNKNKNTRFKNKPFLVYKRVCNFLIR